MAVTIGVDAHKKTHTLVAVDVIGRRLGEKTVPTNTEGHLAALQWASQWAVDGEVVRFAVEDCRHLTRRLEGDLLRAGQAVVRVHTRLMADARRSVRRPGKSDPIDAEAVALAALREPDLPVAQLDGPAGEVKLLVDTRADLVVQRTRQPAACAGICMSSTRRWKSRPAACGGTASLPSCPRGSRTSRAWSPGSPARWSTASRP